MVSLHYRKNNFLGWLGFSVRIINQFTRDVLIRLFLIHKINTRKYIYHEENKSCLFCTVMKEKILHWDLYNKNNRIFFHYTKERINDKGKHFISLLPNHPWQFNLELQDCTEIIHFCSFCKRSFIGRRSWKPRY